MDIMQEPYALTMAENMSINAFMTTAPSMGSYWNLPCLILSRMVLLNE